MNKQILNIILAITISGFIQLANAANYSSFGPEGIISLMPDPSNNGVALAQARSSLYKSTDNGSSWTQLPFNVPSNPSITIHGISNLTLSPK